MTIDQLIAHLQRLSQAGSGELQATVGGPDDELRPIESIEEVLGARGFNVVVVLRAGEG